ncbi:MAG: cytidine deaminase [Bacteroidales bacterium]|nr:cytidine deaminase [Lachnoclostridium sp.]MCM1384538.1 cytidine deaminase [Lachnoclostridium sp.]MCM1464082.1 cytidine deaminase [Bacteroidales bacterium]
MDKKADYDKSGLMGQALAARNRAYAPYSHYTVGAALLTAEGAIYQGCNIENASYGATNCAERTAFFKAVSEGERKFTAIAIVGGPEGEAPSGFASPCGICRQIMQEFCGEDFRIFLVKNTEEYKEFTLAQMLPFAFSLE